MVEIRTASRCEQGQREYNEDKVHVSCNGGRWVAVLADGAGGHRGGAQASRRALESVTDSLADDEAAFDSLALTQAVLAAHDHVRQGQGDAGTQGRMHSTVVVLWVDATRDGALWSHVGDSRLYRVRGGRIDQLTTDDSVVQRMVDAGVLSAEQAAEHPLKNQLMSALGIDDDIDPHTTAQPVALEEGDAFLLCSDGWWGALDEARVLDALADSVSPGEWLDRMCRDIEAAGLPRQDNFSAIAMWVGDASDSTRPMGDAGWR
jgi:serine/threonine protein phosphatase PrpC